MSTDTSPSKPAPALKQLGRYQIIAELGRGAMGTVYHGVDATIERPVALKTLNPELPGEILAEVKERFMREAKSAGRLNHPNIVTIYEFGEDAGTAFIAMEFLEGKSLQDVMRGGRLPFTAIADIVAQVADALDYANRFGVVHRDIKPANIMIAPHGAAKLTDFGIARVQSSSMTQTGAMLGSPKYMSPEQVLGQQADGRADIFSLGVVLYEMLAAATPFETHDITVFSLMQRIVTVPHPPVMEAAPGTPQPFEDMLTRALAKKPEDRYQRASEFANDLRNFRMALSSVPGLVPGALSAAMSGGSGAAGAAPDSSTEYQSTVLTNPGIAAAPPSHPRPVTAPASRTSSNPPDAGIDPAFAVTMASMPPAAPALLGDLDSLGADIDAMQEKFLAEENQAMRKIRAGSGNVKDWGAMAGAIESLPPASVSSPGGASGATTDSATASSTDIKRSSVFGLLRQQSGPNLKEQAAAKQAAEAAALLAFDAKLRGAYIFLMEFFREANEANPQYAGAHSLPYFGACPPLFFSEGVVNARTKRIEDNGKLKDITDHLIVSYRLTSTEQRRITANMQESLKLRTLLDEYEMKYTATDTRNDFNQVTRSVFDIDAAFICAITLHADYANQRAELACRNIGPLGRRRYLVPAAMMNDHLWEELSKLILGYPSAMLDGFAVAK